MHVPFPQVALQKQLAWNDSTVILIYNLHPLKTTFAACTVSFVEKNHKVTLPFSQRILPEMKGLKGQETLH